MAKITNFLKLILEVYVTDQKGKIIQERRIENDLILDNFKKLVAACLFPETTALQSVQLREEGGTLQTFEILLSTSYFGGTSPTGVKLAIGTGETTPSREDYKLASELVREIPTQTIETAAIEWSHTFPITTTTEISEVGLFGKYYSTSAAALQTVLLFWDLIEPPVVVEGGQSITVKYTLAL